MNWLIQILSASWSTFVMAAPWLLVGLTAAGAMHVLIRHSTVARWMGGQGMGSVFRAAAFGVPMPVCSCGVVPLAIALRGKGAGKPASLAFLVTTPESGVDSIALTYGVLGPVMAVVRPVASLITAIFTGGLAILFGGGDEQDPAPQPAESGCCCHHQEDAAEEEQAGEATCHEEPADDDELGVAAVWRSTRAVFRKDPGAVPLPSVFSRALRYGFVRLLDDIAFWLVLGILLTGVIAAFVPDDLSVWGLGGGILPMVLILVVSIPMYVCASASTPVAAALVAKGLSPGAALVFLLAGPATNAASLIVLSKTFGRRLIRLHLIGILLGSLACGFALDALLAATGWTIASRIALGGMSHAGHSPLELTAAAILGLLLIWRLASGAGARGWAEIRESLAGWIGRPADT